MIESIISFTYKQDTLLILCDKSIHVETAVSVINLAIDIIAFTMTDKMTIPAKICLVSNTLYKTRKAKSRLFLVCFS